MRTLTIRHAPRNFREKRTGMMRTITRMGSHEVTPSPPRDGRANVDDASCKEKTGVVRCESRKFLRRRNPNLTKRPALRRSANRSAWASRNSASICSITWRTNWERLHQFCSRDKRQAQVGTSLKRNARSW
jgi:hypothetical protein